MTVCPMKLPCTSRAALFFPLPSRDPLSADVNQRLLRPHRLPPSHGHCESTNESGSRGSSSSSPFTPATTQSQKENFRGERGKAADGEGEEEREVD